MMSFVDYIKEKLRLQEPCCPVMEMATIRHDIKWQNQHFRIAVHGPAQDDREYPHIHIYLTKDHYPYNQFNFEVSLIDILCHDEINLVRQRVGRKDVKHRDKCSWSGWKEVKNGFEEWLFDNCELPGDYIDNLDACIYWYNRESYEGKSVKDYIESHGLKVLDKYEKYI